MIYSPFLMACFILVADCLVHLKDISLKTVSCLVVVLEMATVWAVVM